MKRRLCMAMAGAMTLALLAGCGNTAQQETTEGTTEGTAQTEESTETAEQESSGGNGEVITMSCWYDNFDPVIEAVNEQLNGEYVVEYSYIPLSDYNNVVSTQLQAGEGPDIICDSASFPARIKAGYVKEITGASFLEEFNEAGFSLCRDGDKIYGIPSYGWFNCVWYNKDILEANNVEVPTNFDELLDACAALKANGVQPMAFGLADSDTGLHSLLGLIENDFWEKDGKDFDNEFAYGRAKMAGTLNPYVEHWMKLVDNGYIDATMVGISGEQALNDFIAGKAAFICSGPWYYSQVKESGMNFGAMPNMGSSSEDYYLMGGPAACFGINLNTKNEAGTEKVLEALASLEVQQVIADVNEGAPSYRNGVKVELPEEYAGIKETLEKGNIACPWDRWSVNMPSEVLYQEIVAQIQGLVTGDVTVEGFLEAIDAKADAIRYE